MVQTTLRFVVLAAALSVLASCAGKSLQKIQGEAVLPKELEEQFAVRNADFEPQPVPATQPSPVASVAREAKGRKAKKSKAVGIGTGTAVSSGIVQFPNRRPLRDPIYVGEVFTYNITYFGVTAGTVVLGQQTPKMIGGRKVYHLKADIQSSPVFSMFYRLNDTVESFWDYEGLFSHRYHLVLDEKTQTRDALELYDSIKGQAYYWNRWNHETKGYIEQKETRDMVRFPQDGISILYYIRTIPMTVGQELIVPSVAEGKSWEIRAKILRKESRGTPVGDRECFVLKPEVWFEGKPQNKGEIYLWVTADENRYPVHLEAKVKLGTVHMTMAKIEPGTAPALVPASMLTPTPAPEVSDKPKALAKPHR